MPENRPYKYFQVLKLAEGAAWLVYVFNQEQWDAEQSEGESKGWLDVFAAKDEVSALSRAKMQYPDFIIGYTEGETKEWR